MPRRFAATAAITAALGLAVYGAVPASAADAPTERPALCVSLDAAVTAVGTANDTLNDKEAALADANSKVTELAGVLNGIGADDEGFDEATSNLDAAKLAAQRAEEAKNKAQADVTGAEQNKSNLLSAIATAGINCDDDTTTTTEPPAGTTTDEPPADTTTTEPTDTTTPPEPTVLTQGQIEQATDKLTCSSNPADLVAIHRAITDRINAHKPVAQAQHHLDGKLAALACTAPKTTVTEAPDTTVVNNVVVNPTQDDGSIATTSGDEVTEVPEGSAQTGAA